ncbi:Fur family transcriptional regulator [Ensifer aridi]|uniref:Fur family transcriptional regulator n=1 Tax=Ensifer aridi TaxID=1708715 RepID=UPI0003F99230|nr:Fur family transcriptional regulator [Ensifer aridi]
MTRRTGNTAPALTRNQTLVLSVLEASQVPLSAYSILDRLREHGLRAPLQIYRALEKLLDLGKIHRVESMNAFVLCRHSEHGYMHPSITAFEICEPCGSVNEFHNENLELALGRHVRGDGFLAKRTTIEIRGLCFACR